MTDGGVVLVTTGATIPFEALIRSVLSEAVLKKFAELGFGKLLVQYGKGEKLFHACTAEHGNQPLTISGFDFVPDLGETMKQADLVISHAGTGSILDALRAGKKLIVVVNDSLMENHQLEIANEFANSNYLLMSNPSTSSLIDSIQKSTTFSFAPISPPNSAKVASIIDHEAGL